MQSLAPRLRWVGYLLILAGLARSALAVFLDEPVNQSTTVPGAVLGLTLIALGGYALMTSSFAREGRLMWLILPACLAVLVVVSSYLIAAGPSGIYDYARGSRGLLGLGVFAGFVVLVGTVVHVVVLGLVTALVSALAWLADRFPPLKRSGVGDRIRRGFDDLKTKRRA